jgi:hypothetical protein
MFIFYRYVVFIYPCGDLVDFEYNICNVPRYLNNPRIGMWETAFHIILFNGSKYKLKRKKSF